MVFDLVFVAADLSRMRADAHSWANVGEFFLFESQLYNANLVVAPLQRPQKRAVNPETSATRNCDTFVIAFYR